MAKAKAEATTETEIPVEHGILHDVAMEIFKDNLVRRKGFNPNQLARESFAMAKVFCEESTRIGEGGEIYVKPETTAAPLVQIWDWTHGISNGQFGTPRTNEDTGKPIVKEVPGDPYADAPNLPADHPMNQRYFMALAALGMPIPQRYKSAYENLKAALN